MITKPTSILAFRNGSIGNTLVAVPALRAIKRRYPDVPLSVVVDPVGFELLEHCPWIDALIVYDKQGNDRGLSAYFRLVTRLRRLKPSHAVLFKRFFRNGLLAFLSGAKTRAGFVTDGRASFLNCTIPYDNTISIVDLNLQLTGLLDAKSEDRHLEIFLSTDDELQADEYLKQHAITQPFWVVHYGGKTTAPNFFPREPMRIMLDALSGAHQPILFIGYGLHEKQWAEELCRANPHWRSSTDLPLRTTVALIRKAQAFVGFNSGPAHIAAATATPSLVLFRPDANAEVELRKWSPVGEYSLSVIAPSVDDPANFEQFVQSADANLLALIHRKSAQ